MANCFGFGRFGGGRQGRASTAESSQETPPPSLEEVIAQLEAVNDVSKVDELINIVSDFLQWRIAGKSVEDKAESSQSVASRLINSGATFLKFLNDHAEKSSNKSVEDKAKSYQNVASHFISSGTKCLKFLTYHIEKSSNKADIVNSVQLIIGDVLEKVGNVYWLVAGLSMIGYMLHIADGIPKNYKRCFDLLQKLIGLLDHAKKLDYRLRNQEEKLKRATVVIVDGCILCASQLSSYKLSRFLKAVNAEEALNSFYQKIEYLQRDLILIVEEHGILPDHPVDTDRFAEREVVIKLLQFTSRDKPPKAVVIYGLGGIGKTTLAEAVVRVIDLKPYHHTKVHFNIKSSRNDIKSMQEQILNGLFPQGTKTKFTNCSQGRTVLTKAFQKEGNKPIFLFIDNALRKQDLDELLPRDMKGLPKDSLILVTTRDLGATDMFIEDGAGLERQQYCIQPLSHKEAKNFSLKGGLSSTLVDFAYDHLEKSSQHAFLDICCFFNDKDPSYVEYIVGAQELTSLEEAAFVQRSDDNKPLIAHDIVRERGRNKAESTRIMNVESLIAAANQQRLKDIRGVWLVDKDEPEYEVQEQHLKAMTKLRVLALGKRIEVSHRCEVTFKHLRYLEVGGDILCLPVKLERLPKLAFYVGPLLKKGFSMYKLPKELRVLIAARQSDYNESTYSDESTSTIAIKNSSLKEMDLSELKNLQKVPLGLHLLTSLEILKWKDWDTMKELPKEVCQLTMLTHLTLSGWTSLTCLPPRFGRLTALKDLDLSYCKALKRLPKSFGQLAALEKLDLYGCEALQSLPHSFGQLKALKDLDLESCEALEGLPISFGQLTAVEILRLRGCTALQCLPESFGELKALQYLDLSYCPARAYLSHFKANLKHVIIDT